MVSQAAENLTEDNERLVKLCWLVAAIIAFLLCYVQLGVMISLMASRTGVAQVPIVALAAALLSGYMVARQSGYARSTFWWVAGIMLCMVALALALSAFFYDFSWDGQWYHQTGIINIARDWNPLTDPLRKFDPASFNELWERHYAKGPWYFAAAVDRATGHVEMGKAIDWLSPAAAFFAVLAGCLVGGLRRLYAVGIATVVAINPVVMCESTTFLVDGVMISFLVVAVASIFTCLQRPSAIAAVAGVAAAIVSINAKFTGLVYLCFFLFGAALWCIFNRRKWLPKFVAVAAIAIFLGACVWGYNPYVTNTIYRHQPFYPMLGSAQYPSIEEQNKDGNETEETPKNMMGRSRLIRFGYAIFGRPGNQPYRVGLNASLMVPFTARPSDLYTYTFQDPRVAAFGPLFSGCLILSFGLWIWLQLRGGPNRWLLLLLPAIIVASLLISKHLWWPRYGPQFWLMPIIPIVFALRDPRSGMRKTFASVVLCLLLLNAAIVAFVHLHWEANASAILRTQLRQMHDSGQTYEVATYAFKDSTNVRLNEAGVKYRDVSWQTFPRSHDTHELKSVVEGYPLPIIFRAVEGQHNVQVNSPNQR